MIRAAEAARAGDINYFTHALDQDQLNLVCGKKDEDGRTLLHSASTSGNVELVQLLLRACGDQLNVDGSDPEGWTPLISAASCGHEAVVRFLLVAHAHPDMTTRQGRTALHYAASKGHLSIATALLQGWGKPPSERRDGGIATAPSRGRWTLGFGPSVAERDQNTRRQRQ